MSVPGTPHQPISTILRTGRLEAPSMPVSSSAFPARPPQPSWRIRAMMSRKLRSRHRALVDHLHLAAAIALKAQEPRGERGERLAHGLCAKGNGSLPSLRQCRLAAFMTAYAASCATVLWHVQAPRRRAMSSASRCGACCVSGQGHNQAPLTGRRRRATPRNPGPPSCAAHASARSMPREPGGGAGDTVWRPGRPQRHRCN